MCVMDPIIYDIDVSALEKVSLTPPTPPTHTVSTHTVPTHTVPIHTQPL